MSECEFRAANNEIREQIKTEVHYCIANAVEKELSLLKQKDCTSTLQQQRISMAFFYYFIMERDSDKEKKNHRCKDAFLNFLSIVSPHCFWAHAKAQMREIRGVVYLKRLTIARHFLLIISLHTKRKKIKYIMKHDIGIIFFSIK